MLKLSVVKMDNDKFRIDSAYFSKSAFHAEEIIVGHPGGFARLGELSKTFRKGIFDIKADTYTESGVPFIRIANLRQGIIDDSDMAYISELVHRAENKTEVTRGDLVLSKTGYAAASYVQLQRANVSQDVIACRLIGGEFSPILSEYLAAFLNSRLGILLMQRQFQGNVQLHLSLADGEMIPVPIMSPHFQREIAACFSSSFEESTYGKELIAKAEQTLLAELGLANWSPPEPLTYQRRASEVFAAGRMDAEHYRPHFDALLKKLSKAGSMRLGDSITEPIRRGVSPEYSESGEFLVINSQHVAKVEVELTDNRRTTAEFANRPGNRKAIVRKSDVLLNSTGYITIGRSQCLLEEADAIVDNHVAILRPKADLNPVYLACFLNSLPGLWQSERGWTGSSGQVADYQIWRAPKPIQKRICDLIQSAHDARHKARRLLDAAKRAVEVAIENDEAAGLAILRAARKG